MRAESYRMDSAILVPLFVLLCLTLIFLVFFPFNDHLLFFHDDSFFYIKTAYNISAGKGATFDGVNPTNGYHPLYLLLLSGTSYFFPLRGENGLLTVAVLDTLLTAAGLYVIDRVLQRFATPRRWRCVTLLLVLFGVGFNDFGIEAKLLLPLSWMLILAAASPRRNESASLVYISVLGVLLFLTRLDIVIFLFLIFLHVCTEAEEDQEISIASFRWKRFVALTLPLAAANIAYALYNVLEFGIPQSISSWLKTGWPGVFAWNWWRVASVGLKARILLSALVPVITLAALWFKNRESLRKTSERERLLALLNFYCISYVVVLLLFSRGGVASWYLAFPLSIVCFSMVSWLRLLEEAFPALGGVINSRSVVTAALAMAVLLGGAVVARKVTNASLQKECNLALDMSGWIQDNLPQNARIFQVDSAGRTAYFSERSIIHGGGLVNNFEYQEFLRSGKLIDYLKLKQVQYILYDDYEGEGMIRIHVPVHGVGNAYLRMASHGRQVARFGTYVLLEVSFDGLEFEEAVRDRAT